MVEGGACVSHAWRACPWGWAVAFWEEGKRQGGRSCSCLSGNGLGAPPVPTGGRLLRVHPGDHGRRPREGLGVGHPGAPEPGVRSPTSAAVGRGGAGQPVPLTRCLCCLSLQALPRYQPPPPDPPSGPWDRISHAGEHGQPGAALPESLRESAQPGFASGAQREQRPPVAG